VSVLIDIQNVNKAYLDISGNTVCALKNINLQIEAGEFISFIGPSGCGKTTLLRLIAGLDKPDKGKIFLDGEEITGPGSERGFIFQQPALFPWNTVEENVALPLKAGGVYRQKKADVQKYIDLIGLAGFEKTYPHQLSGGMAQRVAIIRALIPGPKVLLLDEPLGALDAFTRIDMQNELLSIREKTGATFVFVTHDVDEAIYLSTRIVVMSPRPGEVKEIFTVTPGGARKAKRRRSGAGFIDFRKKILRSLYHIISAEHPA